MPEPVSPADTIRRLREEVRLDREGGPPREADDWAHLLHDRVLRLCDGIDVLLAVGERDKAEREAFRKALADEGLPEDASVDDLIGHHRGNAALVADANAFAGRERDRRQIAQLKALLPEPASVPQWGVSDYRFAVEAARAVLAGEEDAE